MTAILFPDPQRATRDALRRTLPLYGLDVSVSTARPIGETGVPLSRPHVRVRAATATRSSRVSAESVVGLTVYAVDEAVAMDVAAKVEAILLDEVADASLRGFSSMSGPVPGTDGPGEPIAYLTLTARLRPVDLAPPRKD